MKQFVLIKNGKAVDWIDPVKRIYRDNIKKIIIVEQDAPYFNKYEYPIDSDYTILKCEYDDEERQYIYEDEEKAKRLGC